MSYEPRYGFSRDPSVEVLQEVAVAVGIPQWHTRQLATFSPENLLRARDVLILQLLTRHQILCEIATNLHDFDEEVAHEVANGYAEPTVALLRLLGYADAESNDIVHPWIF